ncbi:LysR family transcriptional regulator [Brucella abortus]|nr:LysR family transcriptional regulator [Brucella abortus]
MPAQAKNAMNWDDIRIFLAVARSGQIPGRRQALGLNHTTVARRLTALETALSTTLLTRRTSGSTLTHAGEEFPACRRAHGSRNAFRPRAGGQCRYCRFGHGAHRRARRVRGQFPGAPAGAA